MEGKDADGMWEVIKEELNAIIEEYVPWKKEIEKRTAKMVRQRNWKDDSEEEERMGQMEEGQVGG